MYDISQWFERRTRTAAADGPDTHYYTLKDGRPDWLYEACYEAHGDEGPNDWVWDQLDSIASMIHDGTTDEHEIADSLVDVYNADRTTWLAGSLDRAQWVDDARAEGLLSEGADLFEQLGVGQYMQIAHMASCLLRAIEENGDDESDNEEEDES